MAKDIGSALVVVMQGNGDRITCKVEASCCDGGNVMVVWVTYRVLLVERTSVMIIDLRFKNLLGLDEHIAMVDF